MNHKNRNMVWIGMVGLMVLSLGWIWLGRMSIEVGSVSSVVKGAQAPDFTATNEDGDVVQLSDYAGKTLVLNFWASCVCLVSKRCQPLTKSIRKWTMSRLIF